MIKQWNTIAGQLILLIIMAVLVSQLLILSVFFIKTDERIDEFIDHYVLQRIISTYRMIKTTPREDRDNFLNMSSSPETRFSIVARPAGRSLVDKTRVLRSLFAELGDAPIYFKRQHMTVRDLWYFWFTDAYKECFTGKGQVERISVCPYYIFSIGLNETEWLKATVYPPPNELIMLVPVILSALLTLMGITLVVIIVVKRITAPLRALSIAANRMGRGASIDLLTTEGPHELSSTIEAFNVMHERLTRYVQDRTKMLAAISHDLRTPITSLRLRTEFIEELELREKMIKTLEDMQHMVEACLAFSKQDVQEEKSAPINIVQLLDDLADESSYVTFSSTVSAYDYTCRSMNLKRAIRNLLENAVKYGAKAHMSFTVSSEQITIDIQDQGPGIPKTKLEEVFEPFVRLDEARNTESGSVGLGLSIARTIVHKHGGEIKAINTNPGLKMLITLPVI